MSYVNVDGQKFLYADNPRMSPNAETFAEEFPVIVTDAEWLRCRTTSQVYPNTPDYAERSDILEPYFGDPSLSPAPSMTRPPAAEIVNAALKSAETTGSVDLPAL